MENSKFLISVVIPMYNASKTIGRALTSVKNQTFNPLEVIVVNDGSTDDSVSIVEDFIRRFPEISIVLVNKKNGGVSTARNLGMTMARGNFIALLDADDEWIATKLERQKEIMEVNSEIDFLGCSRNNEVLKIFGKKVENLHKASVKELMFKMFPQTSTAIFKKSLFERFGGYNETMTHAEDGNLWVKYCANSNFFYLPESLVITDGGKPSFGFSGLSANLQAMQRGNEFILKDALKNGFITFPFFILLSIFGKLKYLRRIIITKIR